MVGSDRRIRVGFDDQIFEAQMRGGVSRYFVELIERLPEHGIEPVIISRVTRNVHLAESGMVPQAARRSPAIERVTWATWRLIGRPRSTPTPLPALDVMHHTFTHAAYLREWRGPRVVTVHDMMPELFPEDFRLGNPHLAKRRYAEAADAVICDSESTASDMFRLYGVPGLRERTTVIPLGVGEQFFGTGAEVPELPSRYLLFVGLRAGYKDFAIAFAAWSILAARDEQLDFVVVGGGPFSAAEKREFDRSRLSSRVHHVVPRDDEIVGVYRRAAALVFPSRYEGFGLPTLESLAAGTPAVLADASCSREVGGSAALYFTPGDRDELVARLREAMSPEFAASLRARGPARAAEFSWDRTAALTADVYREVAAHAR
ncbi:MAG: glycosyltransferase family 4 protein [Actinomycetota bacterium]|nr:glycosyltransferase family 4 protein [Actinomycetota bacterium]